MGSTPFATTNFHKTILDLQYTLRRLARTPVLTAATLVTLPFVEPDRLIGVWQTAPGVNIEELNAPIADSVT